MDQFKNPRKTNHPKVIGLGSNLAERKLNGIKSIKLAEELAARKIADKKSRQPTSSQAKRLSDRKEADYARRSPQPSVDIHKTGRNSSQYVKSTSNYTSQRSVGYPRMKPSPSLETNDDICDNPTPIDALNDLVRSAYNSSSESDSGALNEIRPEELKNRARGR
jgi:hypothetical protein